MRGGCRAKTTENSSPVTKKRNRRSEVEHRQVTEVRPVEVQRHRGVQHDLQHDEDDERIGGAQPRAQLSDAPALQPLTPQIGEDRARAQSEQRNRNRQKREVVEEHHREQPCEAQFQQQGGEAHQPDRQHGAVSGN